MIEEIIYKLIIAPASVFGAVTLIEYAHCIEQTFRDVPQKLNTKSRLQLTTDYFKELYFKRKGYLVPLVFTSPIYIQFIIDNTLK